MLDALPAITLPISGLGTGAEYWLAHPVARFSISI